MTETAGTVVAEPENNRFTYSENDLVAELTYKKTGDRLVLDHTYVPRSLRNGGIASKLVQAAVDRAKETGETIAPWCPYVRVWLQRHPDEAAAINVDWGEPEEPQACKIGD